MDDNYIKNLLEQTLASYNIIKGLKDKPGDLVILKKSLAKYRVLQVVINKIQRSADDSDSVTEFLDVTKSLP